MEMIPYIIAAAALAGLAPAYIAYRKGHDFLLWWLYGALLFVAALPHSLMLGRGGYKVCGFCRRQVSIEAAHCPRCGYEFIDL